MHHPNPGHPVLALSATSFARPAPLPPAVVIDTEALSPASPMLEADPSQDDGGWPHARRAPAP